MVFLQIAQFVWHQFWDDYDWLRSWSLWEFVKVDIWFAWMWFDLTKEGWCYLSLPASQYCNPNPAASPMPNQWRLGTWIGSRSLNFTLKMAKSREMLCCQNLDSNGSSATNQTCTIHVHIIYTVIDRFRWYQRFGRPSDPVKRPSRPGRRRNWTCQRCLFSCGRENTISTGPNMLW